MALAQRFTNRGVLQVAGTFDETGSTPASRLTPAGNLTINSEFDEVTLQTNNPNAYSYTDTPQYSVLFNPARTSNIASVQTSGGNGAILNARSNNWTIEFWFKSSHYGDVNGNGHCFLDLVSYGTTAGTLYITSGGATFGLFSYTGTNQYTNNVTPYPLNQWNHLALVCNTTLTLFINGVAQTDWTSVVNGFANDGYTSSINQFNISSSAGLGTGVANMYISQVRINNCTSVYTGNFTPPRRLSATQEAGTNINSITSGTMLLACNSSSFVDQSSNAFTLTLFNNIIPSTPPTISSSEYPSFATDLIYTSPTQRTLNYARRQTSSSYQVYNSFDEVSLAYTITPDRTIANEGERITYRINAPLLGSGTLYWTNSGSTAGADFTGGIVYGVTPLTWSGTATATLWSVTGVTQSATSGYGTGAVFDIRKNTTATNMATHGVLTVIPTSPGSGYTVGDTITIDGTSLGLTSGTNNLTITVGSDWFAQGVYPSTVTGTGLGTMTTGSVIWTCPDGVYRISVVCVGGGAGGFSGANPGGGGGGALAYLQDYAVTPGLTYQVLAGAGGAAGAGGGTSVFYSNGGTPIVGAYSGNPGSAGTGGTGGTVAYGTSGFAGGAGGNSVTLGGGGGGAGGYTAVGGDGGDSSGASPNLVSQSGSNSPDGGGGGSTGGGAGGLNQNGTVNNSTTGNGGGGGGTGLLGAFNTGLGGVNLAGTSGAVLGQLGYGGSVGNNGGAPTATVGGAGGAYGGGGGGGTTTGGVGGAGAFRIIWNYPHGFMPSTTALTSITNTKLLTAQSATITDVTGINTITNVASVTAGTTTIPFASTYSYQFNGTSQYLTIPSSSNFIFGATDDFTIEGWLYTSATTINKGLYYKRSGSGISGVNFGTSTTTASRFTLKVANATGSAWTINDETAGTFAINTWYHFAITKTNGVIYLYINGLMTRKYAHTTAIYDDGSVLNIGRDPGGSFWVGFISNLRVVKGTALYYPPSTIVNRNYPDYPYVIANSGSIPIENGVGTLELNLSQDISQENVQDIQLSLRSESTSGTVLATAPKVLVADTSRPLALPGGGQCWCAYPDYVSGPNLFYTGLTGEFKFIAPKGYTTVSVVCIGGGGAGSYNGGGGGGGGALAYSASVAVTPGTMYSITCGNPGIYDFSTSGGASSFGGATVVANGGTTSGSSTGGAGGTVGAGTGFAGGAGGAGQSTYSGGGGGGAGGYTVAGGVGGSVTGTYPSLTAGSGAASTSGGAGGSAGGSATAGAYIGVGGGGGGTSPFGSVAVASIAGTSYAGLQSSPGRGGGGSGGNPTTAASGVQLGQRGYTATPGTSTIYQKPNGGNFGGGGGGGDGNGYAGGDGGPGCVRIIWGTGRAYPATLTADRVSGFPAAVGNPSGQQ